jgi:hypothetical protein
MNLKKSTFIFILVSGILLTACGGGGAANADEQANGAGPNAEIAVNAEDESTAEQTYVYMDCGSDYVQTGGEITLIYYWIAQTEEQVGDFALAVKHAVSVDGKPVAIRSEGNEGLETTDDGYPSQMFWVDIGQLEPGTYDIVTVADPTVPVYDGWSWYGPDQEYPGLEGHCTLTVGDQAQAPDVAEAEPATPAETVCNIENSLHTDWQTFLCDTFDGETVLWTGTQEGTNTRVESGRYVIDNSTKVSQGYTTGFIFPVSVGQAQDYMISVDGSTESLYKSTAWGVFVRSTQNEIVYFFMINNQGRYMLTGSSERESMRYLGNIEDGSSKAIVWDDVNNITAVVDGTQMEFYVNGELVTTHEAIDTTSPYFGLIVWGGEGVNALNYFDDLLVRIKN